MSSGQSHPDWRNLDSQELAAAYSPSSCVDGDIGPFITAYVDRSEAARQQCEVVGHPIHTIRYGPGPSQTVDVAVPTLANDHAGIPLVVFIHGGYWQQLSKNESLFAAIDCLEHGVAFGAVDYTLAPAASLDEIVAECHAALEALVSAAPDHGIDPDRVIVAGSSAGAHLAATVGLGANWRPVATVLVSGIFDLEPLVDTYINDAVGLDLAAARRNSPALATLDDFPRTVIAYGDNETQEFKRQSNDFAALLVAAGTDVDIFEVPGRNHFDVILDLCDSKTPLGHATHNLIP